MGCLLIRRSRFESIEGALIDESYASPGGTSRLRILISDDGALGYGGIVVYEHTLLGYRRVFGHHPAVAESDFNRYTWVSEREFELRFEARTQRIEQCRSSGLCWTIEIGPHALAVPFP